MDSSRSSASGDAFLNLKAATNELARASNTCPAEIHNFIRRLDSTERKLMQQVMDKKNTNIPQNQIKISERLVKKLKSALGGDGTHSLSMPEELGNKISFIRNKLFSKEDHLNSKHLTENLLFIGQEIRSQKIKQLISNRAYRTTNVLSKETGHVTPKTSTEEVSVSIKDDKTITEKKTNLVTPEPFFPIDDQDDHSSANNEIIAARPKRNYEAIKNWKSQNPTKTKPYLSTIVRTEHLKSLIDKNEKEKKVPLPTEDHNKTTTVKSRNKTQEKDRNIDIRSEKNYEKIKKPNIWDSKILVYLYKKEIGDL